MRLSTRLSLVLVAVTSLVALAVGWYAVAAGVRADYTSLNGTLGAVAAAGVGHPTTALSSALAVVEQESLDVTLVLVGPGGGATTLLTGSVSPRTTVSLADARAALSGPRSSADLPGFLYRAVAVGGGQDLVAIVSTRAVGDRAHSLIWRVVLAGVVAALVVAAAARLAVRRDLRAVAAQADYAAEVAAGHLDRPPPAATGSAETRELAEALAHMVTSLQRTIEAEQRVARATQQFIGDASHELRTPLTVLSGSAELLAHPDLDEGARARALERITREVARMDALVGDLLLLAQVAERPEAGEGRCDLSALVRRAVADFASDHPDHPLETDVTAGIEVEGRADWVERILANAVTNVARHAPRAPVRVTLHRAADEAVLAIDDGGPGLEPSAYGRRPERFARADPSRARASGGTGLGLSIMDDLARALGGGLTLSPSALGGLRVEVRLRVAAPPT